MIIINCAHCGKPVRTRPSLVGRKKYCSRSCLARDKTGENARNFKDGRTLLRRTCRQCGREFTGEARNHYCSKECFAASRPQTFLTCLRCGCRFGPVDRLSRKFCSKECANKAKATGRKIFRKGTNRARRAQNLVRYYILSGLMVRPVICEECGATDRSIEAAHYDYDQPLKVRWLCRSCHRRWDKQDPKNGTYVVVNKEDFSETKTAWPKTTPMDAGAVENDFTSQKTKRIRNSQEVSL